MCVRNSGYEASLETRKIYRTLVDSVAAERSLMRVIDESGEDYLFPADLFVGVHVPEEAIPIFGTGGQGFPRPAPMSWLGGITRRPCTQCIECQTAES